MKWGVSEQARRRVNFDELDAGAVVYHTNYLKYCERARNGRLEELGQSPADLLARDVVLAVVAIEAQYARPLRVQDFWIVTRLVAASAKTLTVKHAIFTRPVDEEALAAAGDALESLRGCCFHATYKLVCTSLSRLVSMPMPDDLRRVLGL